MSTTDDSNHIVELVNSVIVSAEDLLRVSKAAEDIPNDKEHSSEAGLFLVARLYKGDFKKATAIYFRMQALSIMLGSEEGLPGWTLPQLPDGSIPAEETVFAAAAIQPLVESENSVIFEREPFMERVLEFAELEMQG